MKNHKIADDFSKKSEESPEIPRSLGAPPNTHSFPRNNPGTLALPERKARRIRDCLVKRLQDMSEKVVAIARDQSPTLCRCSVDLVGLLVAVGLAFG